MPPWLVYRWRPSTPPHEPVLRALDLAHAPSHAIMATGLSSSGHDQSWIADEPPAGAIITPLQDLAGTRAPKPPYRIPTMAEILRVPWNGRTVISAFCGGGGSSTGYRMMGFRVLAAVEFVPAAADTYRRNMAPYTRLLRRDVRQLPTAELLALAGLEVGELDVFDGSPPCEPFSSAGQREASWGHEVAYSGQRQRTDDLFLQFARFIREAQPKTFVAENVTGLVKGAAKGYFKMIMKALRACGYRVAARVLDAARLGVPQHRQRVIIIGTRADLDLDPARAFPDPLPYVYTVRDALPHIARVGTDPNFDRRRAEQLTQDDMMETSDQPAPTIRTRARPSDKLAASGASGMVEIETRSGDNPRTNNGQAAGDRSVRGSIDEPAPSIMALGGSLNEGSRGTFIITQDSRGSHHMPEGDLSDRPLPTVTGSKNATDFQVHEPAFHHDRGSDTQSSASRARNRIDEPAPSITSGGQGHGGGSSAGQYWLDGAADDGQAGPNERAAGFYRDTGGQFGGDPDRNRLDEPSPTVVTTGGGAGTRQLQVAAGPRRRKLTIPELKALCGFPADYVLVGTFSQQWERLGDCVTPPMAAAWAAGIRDLLDNA